MPDRMGMRGRDRSESNAVVTNENLEQLVVLFENLELLTVMGKKIRTVSSYAIKNRSFTFQCALVGCWGRGCRFIYLCDFIDILTYVCQISFLS